MKNKNAPLLLGFAALAAAFLVTCHNPIMERWWEDRQGSPSSSGTRSGFNFGFIVFDAAGGQPQPQGLRVLYGGLIPRLRPMSNGTLGFIGWVDELNQPWDIETRRLSANDDADGDGIITLRAKWASISCAVTFNTNFQDGLGVGEASYPRNQQGNIITVPTQQIALGGTVVEPPVIPTGTGHGLVGWFTQNGHENSGEWGHQWDFENDTVTANITLHARWSLSTRTVQLQVNGGTRPDGVTELTRTHFSIFTGLGGIDGGRIIDPGPLVREGHTFLGWFPDSNPGTAWAFTNKVYGVDEGPGHDPFILHARWEANIYIVAFNAGETVNPGSQNIRHGERVVKPDLAAPHGRVLAGWFTMDGSATGQWGNQWNFDDPTRNSMTLHAKWQAAEITVRFHLGFPTGNGVAFNTSVFRGPPASQQLHGTDRVPEPFMQPLPADRMERDWSFFRWDFHPDSMSVDPGMVNDPGFRAALKPWDFGLALNYALADGVLVKAFDKDGDGNFTLNLYARWIEPVSGMVWVPRGNFIMGDSGVSGTPAIHHAYPTRRVTIDGFFISRTQVTQAEYRAAMLNTEHGNSPSPSNMNGDSHPVERVSWFDAIYYTILRSESENLDPVFSISGVTVSQIPGAPSYLLSISSATVAAGGWNNNGYRLPTEAEWEFAARGGHGSPGNFVFSGSDNADAVAWFYGSNSTRPVAGKQPNALGIFDMSGNVSEWAWDALRSYRDISAQTDNPRVNGDMSDLRVRRGGAWSNVASNVRSVVRNSDPPGTAHWAAGFRVARGPCGSLVW